MGTTIQCGWSFWRVGFAQMFDTAATGKHKQTTECHDTPGTLQCHHMEVKEVI